MLRPVWMTGKGEDAKNKDLREKGETEFLSEKGPGEAKDEKRRKNACGREKVSQGKGRFQKKKKAMKGLAIVIEGWRGEVCNRE